jgi:hypothetical protein
VGRNFTKPAFNLNESETTSSRPFIKNSTTWSRPSTRQRIHHYKKKDSSNEVTESEDSIKNVNFNLETTITQELLPLSSQPTITSTEVPVTRETSIMKIAKTPSASINNFIKVTTSHNNLVLEDRKDSGDLVGSPSEHSQRVAELTISGNENSTFKSANLGLLSRRIPNYFTISTDDPILPIQAFFPKVNVHQNESVS